MRVITFVKPQIRKSLDREGLRSDGNVFPSLSHQSRPPHHPPTRQLETSMRPIREWAEDFRLMSGLWTISFRPCSESFGRKRRFWLGATRNRHHHTCTISPACCSKLPSKTILCLCLYFFALSFFVHLHNYYFIVFISNSMCSSLIFFSKIKELCSFAINKIHIKTQTYLTHEVDNYKSKMKKANYTK